MSRTKKTVLLLILMPLLFVGMILHKWYDFATSSVITQQQGVFADDGMEVWIDINIRVPNKMRLWACKTLLDRASVVLGGEGAIPPYGCQPDYGTYGDLTQGEGLILTFTKSAEAEATRKGATASQLDQVKACFAADFKASLTPKQSAALESQMDSDTVIAIGNLTAKITRDCLTKAAL